MRISRFANPAVLAAFASAFIPSCENPECADEACLEGTSGAPAGASGSTGSSGEGGGQGGKATGTGGSTSGMGGKSPTGGVSGGSERGGATDGGGASDGGEGGGETGQAGSGGEGGAVPVCDASKSPALEACLVSDDFAVFVSPMGSDEGTGSKAAPLASLQAAIALAVVDHKVVLACSAEGQPFTTPLVLTGNVDARVYGGFSCEQWAYTGVRTPPRPRDSDAGTGT